MQRSTLFSECLCFFLCVKEAFVLSDKVWRARVCLCVCTCGSKSAFTQTLLPDVMNIPYLCLSPNSNSPLSPSQTLPPGAKHTFTAEESIQYIGTRGRNWSTLFQLCENGGNAINRSEVVSTFPRWRRAYARVISAASQRGGGGLWMRGKRRFMLMTACC